MPLPPRAVPLLAVALGGCAEQHDDSDSAADSAADDDSTGAAQDDDGSAADGEDVGMECTPDPVPDLCRQQADRWIECVYDGMAPSDGIADGCSCMLQLAQMEYGAECVGALEDYYACLAAADCMDVVLDQECLTEVSTITEICPSLSP